jgi:acetoin utilization deacetylase AcuC-like enzyme
MTEDYVPIARKIRELDVDIVTIMEGGYATADIGRNVSSFLHNI